MTAVGLVLCACRFYKLVSLEPTHVSPTQLPSTLLTSLSVRVACVLPEAEITERQEAARGRGAAACAQACPMTNT